ncbi:MAG: Insertion element protein [Nitrospirales bacterium]|nr:Insertion element protein [Nitrospirales bacterium]
MVLPCIEEGTEIICPKCSSGAVYRYGRTKTGKQRFRCLMCDRQFSHAPGRHTVEGKPLCPICGKIMHLYRMEEGLIRFRCSGYPDCRNFRKFRINEEV